MELIKGMVTKAGFPIYMNTAVCEAHHRKHETCHSCEGEQGCHRFTSLALVMMKPMIYKPRSFVDHQKMERWMKESIDKILDKDTPLEELKEIE